MEAVLITNKQDNNCENLMFENLIHQNKGKQNRVTSGLCEEYMKWFFPLRQTLCYNRFPTFLNFSKKLYSTVSISPMIQLYEKNIGIRHTTRRWVKMTGKDDEAKVYYHIVNFFLLVAG